MSYLEHAERFARLTVEHSQSLYANLPPDRLVSERCKGCQEAFLRPKGRLRHHCPECKIQRSIAAQRGCSEKSGPMWEKTVRAQWKRWAEEGRKLGLLTPDD